MLRKRFLLFLRLLKPPLNHPGWQIFYREVVVWKRLQHPNIVPFLGVPSKVPPFEIVCEWMENDRITEYVREHPEVDRVGLVSRSVSTVTIRLNAQVQNLTVVGCCGWPSPPPFIQCNTWGLKGCKSLDPSLPALPIVRG